MLRNCFKLKRQPSTAPLALSTLMVGAGGATQPSSALSDAIRIFFQLFASRNERDVGGWAVPWMLTKEGGFFCGYCLSVTDLIANQLPRGAIIPFGSAEGGGFTLSVTELRDCSGYAIYNLQKPGG